MVWTVVLLILNIAGNMGCFWLAWKLSGKANRDRIEIIYPKGSDLGKAEVPVGRVQHNSESDLAAKGA
ncbi:MAG TPA: hypothetical protein ENI27_05720 [bacterium]|nr:hypothetical protein [bacterium]